MKSKNTLDSDSFTKMLIGIGKKRNKYFSIPTENHDGSMSDSKKEAALDYKFMVLLPLSKEIDHVIRKERFPFIHNGMVLCSYEADWTVYYTDGRKQVFDAKVVKKVKNKTVGTSTALYRLKKKMMKVFYNIDIQEV
jgi:hypothetical protein